MNQITEVKLLGDHIKLKEIVYFVSANCKLFLNRKSYPIISSMHNLLITLDGAGKTVPMSEKFSRIV